MNRSIAIQHLPMHAASMSRRAFVASSAAAAAAVLAGCSVADQTQQASESEGSKVVNVLVHDSFNLSEERLAAFEEETGYTLNTVSPGDSSTEYAQLELNKDNPTVDAVYGLGTVDAQSAVDAGLIADYVPDYDPGADVRIGGLTAIDYGDVCLNVDSEYFSEAGLAEPTTFDDLLKPEYAGLTALLNPVTTATGGPFLYATVQTFGEDGWQQYWKDLLANGAVVRDSWSEVYYQDFTASGEDGAAYPIVLSYASSPAEAEGRTKAVMATAVREVEYAGVVAGAANEEGAKAFVDFMLSDATQTEIPEQMWMYPVADVDLPDSWATYAPLPEDPIVLDAQSVVENRTDWFDEWTALYEEASN